MIRRRHTVVISLLLLPVILFSQRSRSRINTFSSFEVVCGYKLYDNSFQGLFNTPYDFYFRNPVQHIGFSTNGLFVVSRNFTYAGTMGIAQVLPQAAKPGHWAD